MKFQFLIYNFMQQCSENLCLELYQKYFAKISKHALTFQCGVSISRFVLGEPNSAWYHHDIIICLESDSIVVSF